MLIKITLTMSYYDRHNRTETVEKTVFQGSAMLDYRTARPLETQDPSLPVMVHLGSKVISPAFMPNEKLISSILSLSMSENQAFFWDDLMTSQIDVLTILNGGVWSHSRKQRYRPSFPTDDHALTRTVKTTITFEKSHLLKVLL